MLLDDIADYLTTQGVVTGSWSLYKSYSAANPDTAIIIYETAGMAPTKAFTNVTGRVVEENPGLQVVVRAGEYDYDVARLKANDIWGLLENLGDVSINGVRYGCIYAQQMPFPMGRDEQTRPLVACNYLVGKARSTS